MDEREIRRAAAASDTMRSRLPLMGLPLKASCSVAMGECGWLMWSPCGEWCSTTVIRHGDYFVHNLAPVSPYWKRSRCRWVL